MNRKVFSLERCEYVKKFAFSMCYNTGYARGMWCPQMSITTIRIVINTGYARGMWCEYVKKFAFSM
jgi:hypothetical protein